MAKDGGQDKPFWRVTRRDFLKLSGLLSGALAAFGLGINPANAESDGGNSLPDNGEPGKIPSLEVEGEYQEGLWCAVLGEGESIESVFLRLTKLKPDAWLGFSLTVINPSAADGPKAIRFHGEGGDGQDALKVYSNLFKPESPLATSVSEELRQSYNPNVLPPGTQLFFGKSDLMKRVNQRLVAAGGRLSFCKDSIVDVQFDDGKEKKYLTVRKVTPDGSGDDGIRVVETLLALESRWENGRWTEWSLRN